MIPKTQLLIVLSIAKRIYYGELVLAKISIVRGICKSRIVLHNEAKMREKAEFTLRS